jgi:hypothetical protein
MIPEKVTESLPSTASAVKAAQIVTLVKENQLVTAFVCFILWQIGALATAQSYAAGVMC